MTALRDKAAGSVVTERRRYSVGSYITVGLAAVALGVGAVWASVQIVGSGQDVAAAHQAAVARGELADENLEALFQSGLAQQAAAEQAAQIQSRIQSGIAQQAAIEEAAQLQSRFESGTVQAAAIESAYAFRSAWQMRGAEIIGHLDDLVASGLATQAAIGLDSLQGRFEAGTVQAAAIESAYAFRGALRMRGAEMAGHLEALVVSGLAQQAAIGNS